MVHLQNAKNQFDKIDPLAREDILKFQEKLVKIDTDIDRYNNYLLGAKLDYVDAREEYTTLSDKKKALEQTYNCMREQLKYRQTGKSWKLQQPQLTQQNPRFNVPPQQQQPPKSNQNSQYQLDDGMCKEIEVQQQLTEDLSDIFDKVQAVRGSLDTLRPYYKDKKKRYVDANAKVTDLLHFKEKVKDSLNGFLIMFEVKKENTLQTLSH